MEVIQGTIDSIFTKQVTIKRGPKAGSDSTVYHAMINGHDVNLGFSCELVEGESVTLNVEEKFGGYQVVKGSGVASANGAVVAAKAAAPTVSPKAPAFPTPKNTKDISIIRQNSMTHASRILRDMIDLGIVSTTKVKDEAAYVEKVIEIAYTVFDFSSGHREVKMVEAQAAYAGDDS